MNRLTRAAHEVVYELTHLRWTRSAVLCAELRALGVPYQRGGDAVSISIGELWFDVYAWIRDEGLVWVVDHPHAEPDIEHPGWEIGRLKGFRLHLGEVFHLWYQYRDPADEHPPWLVPETR